MLGMKVYTPEYVADCRARVESGLIAYAELRRPVHASFEASYFSGMVLLLDYLFVHRLRMIEGKDGNALNEVRVLCNSILHNGGVVTTNNVSETTAFAGLAALKLSPETSILKYRPGDEIRLDEASYRRLSGAFFTEIENRFL